MPRQSTPHAKAKYTTCQAMAQHMICAALFNLLFQLLLEQQVTPYTHTYKACKSCIELTHCAYCSQRFFRALPSCMELLHCCPHALSCTATLMHEAPPLLPLAHNQCCY
eukprot:scaffold222437_cov28-Tisochrysis_lutea.AAC.1